MKSILDPTYKYRDAASHGDPAKFAARMRARIRIAQRKPAPPVANVRPIIKRSKSA